MKVTVADINSRFPTFEKELVNEIVENSQIKLYKKGDYLVRSGHYFRSTFIVFDGLIKVIRENDNGSELFMHHLKSGEACGLSMVYTLRNQTSRVTIRAVEKTAVLLIPFASMEKWLIQYRSWYQFVWQNFRELVDEFFEFIDTIAFLNMDERLAYYLKRESRQLGTNFIPGTQTEIARELNSSREVIGRLLKKLSDQGSLKVHRNYIELIRM